MDGANDELNAEFRSKTVLVTGASGFIGSRLVERLASAGARLRTLTRSPPPRSPALDSAELVLGDVRDADSWTRALPGSDFVFHLAAQTSARASENDPLDDLGANLEGTRQLLEACRRLGTHARIVFAGSITQCGVPSSLPIDGTEPDRPRSFYDLHKLAAEQFLEFFARRGHVSGTSLRLPSVYGPGAREGSTDCGVLNAMIRAALSGETLRIYGGGDRLRDYLHVEDAVRAFLLAAAALDRASARHFVVGSGESHTVAQAVQLVVDAVEKQTGRRAPVVHVEPPADEPDIAKASFSVDASEFRTLAGWTPRFVLVEGIEMTVRSVVERMNAAAGERA